VLKEIGCIVAQAITDGSDHLALERVEL